MNKKVQCFILTSQHESEQLLDIYCTISFYNRHKNSMDRFIKESGFTLNKNNVNYYGKIIGPVDYILSDSVYDDINELLWTDRGSNFKHLDGIIIFHDGTHNNLYKDTMLYCLMQKEVQEFIIYYNVINGTCDVVVSPTEGSTCKECKRFKWDCVCGEDEK